MIQSTNTHNFLYSCSIPFHLADPAGILFFSHVFTLFHQAFEQFVLDQMQSPWPFWFQNPDWVVPIKHAEAQYFYPLQAGQHCQIELSVTSVSTSSFVMTTFFHQIQLCSTVKTVHVFCDRLNKEKIAIPATFLPIFKSLIAMNSSLIKK